MLSLIKMRKKVQMTEEEKKENKKKASNKYYHKNAEVIKAKKRENYTPKEKKPKPTNEELIEKAVYYDEDKDAWCRDETCLCNPKNKNQAVEFLWVIESITRTKFNETEWENLTEGDEMINAIYDSNDDGMCICSHRISHSYIIRHKPTNNSFEVGCDCVKKISPHLYNVLTKTPCKWCKNPILDKRKIHGRYGYCCEDCYKGSHLHFGKYKGKCINEIPLSYIRWAIETHQKSPFLRSELQYEYMCNQYDHLND